MMAVIPAHHYLLQSTFYGSRRSNPTYPSASADTPPDRPRLVEYKVQIKRSLHLMDQILHLLVAIKSLFLPPFCPSLTD